MRLLAIGYPLPHVDIDNYSALTAPSYFDYDALFIDPASITAQAMRLQEEGADFEAHDGRPIVNAPGSATVVSAGEQFQRRTEETRRLLEAGGAVIVVARPNVVQGGVRGFEGLDRYHWLPAPAGMAWSPPFVVAAEGKTIRVAAEDHPLAPLLREFRRDLRYRAVFDERQAAFARSGRVLGTGGSGAPIAVEFSLLGGRVVFVPALPEEGAGNIRSDLANGVVDIAKALLRSAVPAEPPYWARSIAVPGIEEVEAELTEAEAAAKEATARLAPIRERHGRLAAYRQLVTEDGAAFTRGVEDALLLLGFAPAHEAGEPLAVESEGRCAFVECEGSREAVVEWPYVRLQRRLEQRLLQAGDQLKGIVVVNGWRGNEPAGREAQFTEQLRIACENYRYCLLTGETVLAMANRALAGAGEGELAGFQRRVMATNGLLTTAAALGDEEEQPDAGPIF